MKTLLVALSLCLPLFLAAPAQALDAGIDYLAVSPTQGTQAKAGQVEVLEFFWYRCPHCYHLEPELNAWMKKLPKEVVFKRVPGILNEKWIPLAKAYYALESLGLVDKLHGEVFHAIHQKDIDLNTPSVFFDWAAKKGVDRAKLEAAYHSFGVSSSVMQAQQMTKAYGLSGVPAFAVQGKYTTSAYITGSNAKTFEVLDALIAQERKGKAKR